MIELMQKLNFPLLEVQPVTEYFRQFEKYEIIEDSPIDKEIKETGVVVYEK